jgi:hypothetical protein
MAAPAQGSWQREVRLDLERGRAGVLAAPAPGEHWHSSERAALDAGLPVTCGTGAGWVRQERNGA